MAVEDSLTKPTADPNGDLDLAIIFSHKDVEWILSHENEPMVINMQCNN